MRTPATPQLLPLPRPLWSGLLACLALLHPSLSPAQGVAANDAARPDAPTLPLIHQGVPPQPSPATSLPSSSSWHQANEAVAAFPRGHADILAWEAQNSATPLQMPATAAPKPSGHHGMHSDHHGGTPHHPGMRGTKP